MKLTPKIDCPATKPRVIVDLPPLLEAYCRFVFQTPPNQETIVVSRKNVIGKAVNGFIEKTSDRTGQQNFVNPVVFAVPETDLNKYSLSTKFIYMRAEENEAFTDRVETLYSGWIENLFREGYAMNLDQISIIECVLDILNVRLNVATFDQIKKYDYRNRRRLVHERAKILLMQRVSID